MYMDWVKVLLSLVIILLYIPMVFMGANVFFPKFTGSESYYSAYKDCGYVDNPNAPQAVWINNATCQEEQRQAQIAFDMEKNAYDGNKYIFIVLLNLVVLLFAVFVSIEESVVIGLFLGSTLTTFFSTWTYFETKSKIGFGILVAIFFITIYFISKKKHLFLFKKEKK